MVGVVLDKSFVFFNTCTTGSVGKNLRSISFTTSLVLPSRTTKLGALLYPLPAEVTPIDSNPVKGSIFNI